MLNFFKKSIKTKHRSETLIEVVIALAVISVGITSGTNLVISAMQNNAFNRDSVIAKNLAEEGIEYRKNLRETNWIAFSFDKSSCWNILPGSPTCPASGTRLFSGNFILSDTITPSISTTLIEIPSGELDLKNNSPAADLDNYRIKLYDLATDYDTDGDS